jgi:sarcosine oxidase delta subunit
VPTSSNYLCGCGRFMRPKKNSVTVEEVTEDGRPYKLWDADLWECPECGNRIVAGFASQPLAEHYQHTYEATRAARARQEHGVFIGRCS